MKKSLEVKIQEVAKHMVDSYKIFGSIGPIYLIDRPKCKPLFFTVKSLADMEVLYNNYRFLISTDDNGTIHYHDESVKEALINYMIAYA